ncbi:transglycosylase domain-containing protein [Fischerella thermalis]|uniref:transglycosylase domain-containing protein n=1 Tax=Fischerella thermalis TaxID=372787 RepID=UPI0019EF4CE0|nr:penicillin-binding protein 1A [Fischerella thermalis]MBF1989292.1 penicillin-binding protein 1A [Fischerella thermalis M58_A2018_009]MBF2060523.1 penicillin-binding protein 1A [Fischerella thermalis M66_A2018_004]
MGKFTSWFKERTTKLSDSQTAKSGSAVGDTQAQEESTSEQNHDDNRPPTKLEQAKQIFTQVVAKFPGSHKPLYRRYWFWAGLGVSGGVAAVCYGIWSIDQTLPNKTELTAVVREQTLTIKAADGTILQQQGEATREQLKLEEIPDKFKKAFIASEDRRFYKHDGVDAQGIVRAVLNNLRSQNVVEGGSTITQQLARILFLKQERTIWRKLKEARLAQKIEDQLSKEQILERYLNLVYLGSGAYGIADAAWVYFSKPVHELTLGEMATIAALPPAPNRFSPQVNLASAQQRRNLVLQRMYEDGYITKIEKDIAVSEKLAVRPSQPKRWQVEAPYFISYIQKELPKYVSPEVLNAGGLTVETSLNLSWQKMAEEAVDKTLRNQGRWENFKEGALVAIDPRTGEIKAMVGGKDFSKNQFNRVTQAQRQPGSTFKGFVYATAIATGKNPYDGYEDAPLIVDDYEPKNFSENFYGWMNMRDALTKSINIIAVKVLMDIGFEPTIKLAHDMGIKSELKPMYSLALGSNEVNLLELTSAYGSFATQGLHVEPHGITRILNRQGQVIWRDNFQPKRALDAESAAIMTWMLRNVVSAGTGAAAQLNDRPVAGKTGTTDEARDLWFIGFIPQLVTGVWLGNDDNKPTAGSSSTAAYTWREFMEKATEGMPVEKFPERPKLEGRKGTIKAQRVKPKKIVNPPAPSNNEDSDGQTQQVDSNNNQGRSSRRRRYRRTNYQQQEQQQEQTPRQRRRRYQQQQAVDDSSSQRSYRRRHRSYESASDSASSSQSRRRYRQYSNSSTPVIPRIRYTPSANTSSISTPTSSWRERLKPSSSQ